MKISKSSVQITYQEKHFSFVMLTESCILCQALVLCDSQYREKEKMFKAQLMTLSTLLPTLHVHLVMSGAFSSATNKFEFLDLAYVSFKIYVSMYACRCMFICVFVGAKEKVTTFMCFAVCHGNSILVSPTCRS